MAVLAQDVRLILAHKQSTSARVRFLCFSHGIIAFEPLPRAATFEEGAPAPQVIPHPGTGLRRAEQHFGLPGNSLQHEAEFVANVHTPDSIIVVNLATFKTIDPPFAAAESVGGRFIAITDAKSLPDVELNLLRHAYQILV